MWLIMQQDDQNDGFLFTFAICSPFPFPGIFLDADTRVPISKGDHPKGSNMN